MPAREEAEMDVRVICALAPWDRPETDYVCVRTSPVAYDDTIVLATIERVIDKDGGEPAERTSLTKRIKTLVARRPMTTDAAFVLATSYAERKKIPVVYAD
jgi:hypothetical protein